MSAKRIRPRQGKVLVELVPYENTDRGLHLPENRKTKDNIGRKPAQRAIVKALGVWPTTRTGRMVAYEFRVNDRVWVDPTIGLNLEAYPTKMKLYDHLEILAVGWQ